MSITTSESEVQNIPKYEEKKFFLPIFLQRQSCNYCRNLIYLDWAKKQAKSTSLLFLSLPYYALDGHSGCLDYLPMAAPQQPQDGHSGCLEYLPMAAQRQPLRLTGRLGRMADGTVEPFYTTLWTALLTVR